MSSRTHLIIGTATGYMTGSLFTLFFALDIVDLIIAAVLTPIYSLLPDIDYPHSKLGKYIPILPHLIEHRTYTHTVWFCLITSLPFVFISIPLFICCLAASLSHLVLDGLTPSGVRPFMPFYSFKMKWIIKTGGRIDRLIRSMPVLVVLLIAVLFMYLFYWLIYIFMYLLFIG